MPLMPKRTKYRKQQKGRNRGKATRGNFVSDGEYGLQTLEAGLITTNQIESARVAMTRYIKRGGKVWIKIFPDKPITKKPAETRMGKGKGAVEYWVAPVKPGRVMFEIAGVTEDIAREALRLASMKLPVKCKFVKGENAGKELTFSVKESELVEEEEVKEETAEVAEVKEETEVGGE
ncbi:MAG: 50S ribosomal protein L16 [Clostridia bacterium]|nr:50S ribosomal protein L16 [Clostridia bacterium]